MVTLPTQHWLKPPSHCTPRFISNSTPPFIRFHKETPQNSVWFAVINLRVYSKVSSLFFLPDVPVWLNWRVSVRSLSSSSSTDVLEFSFSFEELESSSLMARRDIFKLGQQFWTCIHSSTQYLDLWSGSLSHFLVTVGWEIPFPLLFHEVKIGVLKFATKLSQINESWFVLATIKIIC